MTQHFSALAGVPLNEFKHNNMTPFFGSKLSQNMDSDRNEGILQNHVGSYNANIEIAKNECANPSDLVSNRNLDDTPFYDSTKDRYQPSMMRQGERPVDPVYVGPGIRDDSGDLTSPSGGFQQDQYRDLDMYKNVDSLRPKNKQRVTFEGRVLPKVGISNRPSPVTMDKNRTERFVAYDECDMIPNRGAAPGATSRSQPIDRATQRRRAMEVKGPAFDSSQGVQQIPQALPGFRQEAISKAPVHNRSAAYGIGDTDDYGRSSTKLYSNSRTDNAQSTTLANITSIVKSLVSPLTDKMRRTNKELYSRRREGYDVLQQNIPGKSPVHDPNDVARTTVKETTIHDARTGNMRSFQKTTVYDPNDVARTTIKETAIHDTRTGPLSLPTSVHYSKAEGDARTTVRQTLENEDYNRNMDAPVHKQTVYDPSEVAKTTIKETTLREGALGGVGTLADGSGYLVSNSEARNTSRQFMSDKEHYGQPTDAQSDAYRSIPVDARPTSKQFVSDHEHYGAASSATTDAQRSYEDIYNSIINATKEMVLEKPDPTPSGAKSVHGGNDLNVELKNDTVLREYSPGVSRIYQNTPSSMNTQATRDGEPNYDSTIERLDPSLMKPLENNPYAISVT